MKSKIKDFWRFPWKQNKKAQLQIPGAIVDFYAIIAFVLVILIFILLFFIRGCTSENRTSAEIQVGVENIDGNRIMLNYLRTPVIVDGNEMTMADLIVLYKSDSNFRPRLRTNTQNILGRIYSQCFVLCIDDTKFEFNDCTEYRTSCRGIRQAIPYPDQPIDIRLDIDPEVLSMEGGGP
jgi:hypothetical protein